jgi:8-oxo-dGTP diphosphatase
VSERIDVALAVALRSGKVLVARRAEGSHLPGLWEFPGGKVEAGESAAEAAERELREETSLAGDAAEPLTVFVHSYPDREVRLHAFLFREPRGEVRIDRERPWDWVLPGALSSLPMPEANRAVLRALAWRLGSAGRTGE